MNGRTGQESEGSFASRLFSIAIALVLSLTVAVQAQTATPPSGAGTSGDPYKIQSLANLYWIAQQADGAASGGPKDFAGKYFVQTAHIDASATATWPNTWLPIGYNSSWFSGSYDGQGYEIRNLTIRRTDQTNVGLFSELVGGTLTNIVLVDVSVTGGSISGLYNVGALVGMAYSYTGYGNENNVIRNCSATGSVSGYEAVGGLVGLIEDDGAASNLLQNSWADCQVTSLNGTVGGLVGQVTSDGNVTGLSTIQDCYALGSVGRSATAPSGVASYVYGGLVGDLQGTVMRSFVKGTLQGNTYVGGLIGKNKGVVRDCFSASPISAPGWAGGIAGTNGFDAVGTITTSYSVSANSRQVTADPFGGLVGDNLSGSSISQSHWNTDIWSKGYYANTGTFSGTGKTTAQMQDGTTFPGWSTSTWSFQAGRYPVLKRAPIVNTSPISTYTAIYATMGGSVYDDGGQNVTARGVVYSSTNTLPTVGGTGVTKVDIGTGAGTFSQSVGVLLPVHTTYYVRAYATNASGTSYGRVQMVTTNVASSAPIVSGISPSIGSTLGGASVVITGTSFVDVSAVKFGTTNATSYTVNSGTQITATAPAGAGTVDVIVTTYWGSNAASAADRFTYALVPGAATGGATAITTTSATLNGTVNPNNASTVDSIQYGQTTSYGATVAASPATSSGTTPVAISHALGSLSPNTTYHYRVKASNAIGASYGNDTTFTTLPLPPAVATLDGVVTGSRCTQLKGTVNPNGVSTTVQFDFGKTTSYGTSRSATTPGDNLPIGAQTGTSVIAVQDYVCFLEPSMTYHYRVVATSSGGTSYGVDKSFTTMAESPWVTTGDASSIAATSTTVSGTVNASNLATTDSIQYGTSTAYGTTVAANPATMTRFVDSAVSANLTGLRPNTTYHYRVKAVNSNGSTYGSDKTFTTQRKTLTITGAMASDKVYDGTTSATVVDATLSGAIPGDDVTLVLGTASFANKDTGTARIVTVSGSSLSGADADRYSLIEVSGLSAKITAKPITVVADAKAKVYGSIDPSLTYAGSTLYAGDSYTGSLARASGEKVGSFGINQGDLTAGGNYAITFTGADLEITRKPLTITGAVASDKVYDGTSVASVTGAALDGVKTGDAVTLVLGAAAFADKNVGSKSVTVTGSKLDGADTANYSLTEVSGLSAAITVKPITVTADAKSKVYGSADPSLTYTAPALYTGDSYTGSLLRATGEKVGSFDINQGDLTAGGNYAITFTGANLEITKKPLTITGAVASSKVYDGTPVATVTGAELDGVKTGDAVTLVLGAAAFADKNVGSKSVTVTGSKLDGADTANYSLTDVSGLGAKITAKPITVVADAKSKVYGSTDPALTYTASTLFAGDSYTGSLARASGEKVGGYAIAQGALSAGGNYAITFTGANLEITRKSLTITGAVASSKVYDGTPVATVTGAELDGVKAGDAVTLVLGTAAFADKNVGSKSVTVTGSKLDGADTANYSLTEVSGLDAKITAKPITVVADAKSKVYGSADPSLTYTASILFAGDSYTGSLARASGEKVGGYAIAQGALSAGGNYAITFTGANLGITRKSLTITGAVASNKVYDGTSVATVTGAALDGVKTGDAVTLVLGAAAFADKNVGTGKSVAVTGSKLDGADAGNYSLTEVSGLNAKITAKPITVVADAKSKVYGTADPSLTYTASTLFAGDSYTGSLVRASGEKVGSYGINQGDLSAGGNYATTFTGADLAITKRFLSITGAVASDKVYDGTAVATVKGAALDGVKTGDAVTLVLGTAAFADKKVGTGKSVTVTGSKLDGADAGNYSLTEVSGLSAKITAKPITVAADAKSKVYGSADPSLTYMASTLFAGDSYTGSLARASGEKVGAYGIAQGTLGAGSNYAIAFTGADLTIAPATLEIRANDASKFIGEADPSFSATITGFVNGDTRDLVKGLSITRSPGSAMGTYPIIPGGAAADNYSIVYQNGTLTIKVSTAVAPRRSITSTALESRVSRAVAQPAIGHGQGELGLVSNECEEGTCLAIDLALSQPAEMAVGIYDNMGTPVIDWKTAMGMSDFSKLARMDDGRHRARLVWNLRSRSGAPVSTGVYLWQIKVRLQDGTELEEVHRLGVKMPR